ncbi:amidohydrolase [candidate division WOR-3 bacterium]|nr:amidohydrolase [candidate division WOR-3 bacterium]
MKKIIKKAYSIKDEIIGVRRELHRNPELAFQEHRTHNFIVDYLARLGLKPITKNSTGIIADIGDGDKRIALRADMDALPINEETPFPYKSQNKGIMHACGHDTHMAMLLGAARLFVENPPKHPVRLLFQPSEEKTPGGALGMIKEGALKGVSEIYGLHIDPELEIGSIKIKSGAMMAAADEMDITLKGEGGHGAEPHKTADPIYIASLFVNQLQGLISRKSNPVNPLVISICSINGGSAYNIIPSEIKLKGTIRTIDKESWQNVPEWIANILKGLKTSYQIDYELQYRRGYPALINNTEKTAKLISIAKNIFENVVVMDKSLMWGEDFAYYLENIPGAFAFIGGANREKGIYSKIHTPYFSIDEDALPLGSALLYALANENTNN